MTKPQMPRKGGMPKWLLVLLIIFIIIVLGCCGGFVTCTYLLKKVGENAPGFIANQLGMTVDALPPNFPSDIPVMPGLKPKFGMGRAGTESGFATLMGSDAPADVSKWYEGEMKSKGW